MGKRIETFSKKKKRIISSVYLSLLQECRQDQPDDRQPQQYIDGIMKAAHRSEYAITDASDLDMIIIFTPLIPTSI